PRSRGLRQAASRRVARAALTRLRMAAGSLRQTRLPACSITPIETARLPQEDVFKTGHDLLAPESHEQVRLDRLPPAWQRHEVAEYVLVAAIPEPEAVLEQIEMTAQP